jgi:integrase/recombinase XerD
MVFLEELDNFIKHLEVAERSPRTLDLYKVCLTRFHNSLSSKLNRPVYVEEVTAEDFEKYLFEPPNDINFSQSTRRTFSTAFKSFYSYCYNKGLCKANIGKSLTPIKGKPKERTFISEDELLKLVDEVSNETDKVMLKTMYFTGIRVSEAFNLTLDDINFQENYINVRKLKGRYDRKIPISIKLYYILEQYYNNYRNSIDEGGDSFFIRENGSKYTIGYINRIIKRATIKAELNINISTHIMRHAFASGLAAKGVDVVKIKKLLGHEGISTTNIYLHTNLELLKNAVDRL